MEFDDEESGDDDFDDESKWWPAAVGPFFDQPPMRAADTCYGVLGPSTTLHLLQTLNEAKRSGVTIPKDIQSLMQSLESVVGRQPDMLVLLGIGAGLAMEAAFDEPTEDAEVLRMEAATVAKLLGSLVVEAMERFGFDATSFRDYVRNEWDHGFGPWPPRSVMYGPIPPV